MLTDQRAIIKFCVDMTLCLNTVLRVAKMDISRKMFKKGGAQFGI